MSKDIAILVVEDSPTMRLSLELALTRQYTVLTAEDGDLGLAIYEKCKPDIILLDVILPGLDGFQILERVREKDPETFIIMLTAEESVQLRPRALNQGANDFLYKPFDRTELLARVGVAERQVRLTRRLTRAMQASSREIEMLASLQARLLPRSSPRLPGVRVETLYRPSGLASGDYYDYFLVDDEILRLVVADVSGHGARAAFLMAIVRTLFRLSQHGPEPLEQTLNLVNSHLTEIIGDQNDFVTMFAADIDFSRKTMKYLSAGHCPAMLMDPEGNISRLDPAQPMLGFFAVDFTARVIPFDLGSGLFLYTDGFIDWTPGSGPVMDMERFWSMASDLMRRGGPLLDDIMAGLGATAKDIPGVRDDLTALWVRSGATG